MIVAVLVAVSLEGALLAVRLLNKLMHECLPAVLTPVLDISTVAPELHPTCTTSLSKAMLDMYFL